MAQILCRRTFGLLLGLFGTFVHQQPLPLPPTDHPPSGTDGRYRPYPLVSISKWEAIAYFILAGCAATSRIDSGLKFYLPTEEPTCVYVVLTYMFHRTKWETSVPLTSKPTDRFHSICTNLFGGVYFSEIHKCQEMRFRSHGHTMV